MKSTSYRRCLGLLAGVSASFGMASSAADYADAVLSDGPAAYYRLNDPATRSITNLNSGSLGAPGNATQDLGRVHTLPGAVVGDPNRAAFFDFTSRTEIPWNAALNPPNNQPFTIEAWFYPASDQTGNGQCPLNNRFAYSGADRQGWVFFQRKPNETYEGSEPVGWNFRMFRGAGSSSGLDVTSRVPYELGKWTHMVVVYDPVNLVDATVTMYIDGVEAASTTWNGGPDGTSPGYVANTNDHDPSVATFGPAGLAIGNYNNTAGTSLNPFFGGVDEFAFYSTKLTPQQIAEHYQNATNANRTVSYESLILSRNPVAYLRLDENAPGPYQAVNLGELRAAGHGTHTEEVRSPAPGPLNSQATDTAVAYHNRNGNATTTLPWTAGTNPNAGIPFSLEFWVRPMRDQQGGQCPMNNRWVGGTGRTGWVIFQRNPNLSYPASEGHGWNFRMFNGAGNSGSDVNTDTDYTIGEWQHLTFTWEPEIDNGDPAGNGNNQWQGRLSAYVNGQLVNVNESAIYAANTEVPEDGGDPADLGIGSYNAKSGLGNNPFEGDLDEIAFYNNYVLTPEQILSHYQTGTNTLASTRYETLVLTAPFTGPERQGPALYLRFQDAPRRAVANTGTLGSPADGTVVLPSDPAPGPRPPAFAGFEASNAALALDGLKQWASLNRPAGLNFAGQITLSAWIQPAANPSETEPARILAHGPPTVSDFLQRIIDGEEIQATVTNTAEISLRIENVDGEFRYSVGTWETRPGQEPTFSGAQAPVPTGDLGASTWVHLAGTFDGATWRLYRNGTELASAAGTTGALALSQTDWAIGSIGHGWAGPFAGAIDEVAIYDKALPASRLLAQYTTAVSGSTTTAPTGLAIVKSGASAIVSWTSGTLQQADLIQGPFSDVTGATSPLTVTPTGTQKYYRLRQ